jgi:MFS family permease
MASTDVAAEPKALGGGRRPLLTAQARLIVITSLIGWTLANMDQSFFTWAYPYVQKDFHIGLSQVSIIYLALYISGWAATFAVGPLMELFGRKPIFQLTLLATALGSVISALSLGFSSLLAGRVVASAGAAAENFTSQVMNIESVPGRRKGMLVALAQIGYPLGWFLSAGISLIAIERIGWRGLFFIGLLPALFVLYLRLFVREPDRSAELLRVRREARRAAAGVGMGAVEAAATRIETRFAMNKQEAVHSPLRQLFFKDVRARTLWLSLWFFVVNVANAGATTYLPTIAAQRGISQSAIQLIGVVVTAVAVVGYLTCAYLGTLIGRRNAMAIFYGIGIGMGVLVTFFGTTALSFGLLYSLWWFFAYGIYGCAITYIMESFPTRVRGTGSNFVGQWVWAGFVVYTLAASWILQTLGATAALLVFLVGVAAVAFVILLFNRNIDPNAELEEIAI